MRVVLQRVTSSTVVVDEKTVGQIGNGYLVLLGVSNDDTKKDVEVLVEKISKLRIFEDKNGKVNLAINDVKGELLVVSQFTLYAECKKGNRPSFTKSGTPDYANELYKYFKEYSKDKFINVESGIFGADMKVSIENDGPFTIIMECINGTIIE